MTGKQFRKAIGIGYIEQECGCVYNVGFEHEDLVQECFRHEVQRIRRRALWCRAFWAVYWIGGMSWACWWTWG